MIRYVNDRFVDIELIISEDSGLKIPNSAITSKEFFTIPKEYFTLGGDSSDPGLLIQRQDDKFVSFLPNFIDIKLFLLADIANFYDVEVRL